jgi:hypothetical protein
VIRNFVQGQDEIDLSPIDANTNQPDNQAFTFVASTNNPDIGEVSYFKSGTSTIVVADTGAVTFQIELKNFDQPLLNTDFSLQPRGPAPARAGPAATAGRRSIR